MSRSLEQLTSERIGLPPLQRLQAALGDAWPQGLASLHLGRAVARRGALTGELAAALLGAPVRAAPPRAEFLLDSSGLGQARLSLSRHRSLLAGDGVRACGTRRELWDGPGHARLALISKGQDGPLAPRGHGCELPDGTPIAALGAGPLLAYLSRSPDPRELRAAAALQAAIAVAGARRLR